MAVRQCAAGVGAEQHRRSERLGHALQVAARVGAYDAVSGDDGRPLGIGEHRGGAGDERRVGGRCGVALGLDHVEVAGLGEIVLRYLDLHRLRATRLELPEGLVQQGRDFVRRIGASEPLGDRPHEIELVVDLVQGAVLAAQLVRGHLPGDQQDGGAAGVGGRHRSAGVVGARAGHHQRDADLARRAGVAVGREHGRLLVAAGDQADLRGVVEAVVDVHHLVAGNGEDGVHALGHELPDDGVAGGHSGHPFTSGIPALVADGRWSRIWLSPSPQPSPVEGEGALWLRSASLGRLDYTTAASAEVDRHFGVREEDLQAAAPAPL